MIQKENIKLSRNFVQKWRNIQKNKRGYSAEGSTLLPSALRPRLFGIVGVVVGAVAIIGTSIGISNSSVSAVSATLSVPDNISINVDPTKDNGFAKSDNESVSVSTGNLAGYTLSIKSSNDNKLRNSDNVLNSITETLTEDSYSSGNNYINTWGFKPSSVNNENNTSYIPGPTTSGITLAKTNVNSSTNENYSLGIAAKVDNSLIAGNYTNTFTLTATANEAWYTVNYDISSLSGATNANLFTTDSNIITGDTQSINTNIPARSDKEFKGWCDEPLQSDGSCKGSVIQAGGNLRMCKCNTDVTLYAMWGDSQGMQTFNKCNLGFGEVTTMTDTRDNNVYKIAKLEDGNCWMTENLRISGKKLTKEDSNVSSDFQLPENSWQLTPGAINVHIDPAYGGYYSFPAATAGSGSQSTKGEALYSICPKGWRLPSKAEYEIIIKKYKNINPTQPPLNFQLNGRYMGDYDDGSKENSGLYWTSTGKIEGTSPFVLIVYPSSMFTNERQGSDYTGAGVRCILNY